MSINSLLNGIKLTTISLAAMMFMYTAVHAEKKDEQVEQKSPKELMFEYFDTNYLRVINHPLNLQVLMATIATYEPDTEFKQNYKTHSHKTSCYMRTYPDDKTCEISLHFISKPKGTPYYMHRFEVDYDRNGEIDHKYDRGREVKIYKVVPIPIPKPKTPKSTQPKPDLPQI